MKWVLFFLIITSQRVLALEGFSELGAPVPENIKTSWNATASIEATFSNGAVSKSSKGTGVLIDYDQETQTGYVLTNGHVAGCPSQKFRCSYWITFFTETKTTISSQNIKLKKEAPEYDLALLEVKFKKDVNLKPARLALSIETINNYEQLYAIGYPNVDSRKKSAWTAKKPNDSSRRIKRFSFGQKLLVRKNVTHPKYPYAAETTTHFDAEILLTHNADTLKGNSGGPIVLASSDEIIGINSGVFMPAKGNRHCESNTDKDTPGCTYFAIPADLIQKFLIEN